jgi:polyketide biosynthesis enoyl-CoA hydratase PksH
LTWSTINVRFEDPICYIKFNRPEVKNAINNLMIEECHRAIMLCEERSSVVIFEGSGEVFCFGADFHEMEHDRNNQEQTAYKPELLYDLWLKMASGSFITVSHVQGAVNAGGVGFVAASDIVIANDSAVFSLSELLFGLFPAMVLPFLIRKIGHQRAHYLTLLTKPVGVKEAYNWGLVDAYQENSTMLLRRHLSRMTKLPKSGIKQYKNYMIELNDSVIKSKDLAIAANRNIFSNHENLENIHQYIEKGIFPWER